MNEELLVVYSDLQRKIVFILVMAITRLPTVKPIFIAVLPFLLRYLQSMGFEGSIHSSDVGNKKKSKSDQYGR